MFRLVLSQRFKKNLQTFLRKHPELKSIFRERVELLQKNPRNPKLRTHKLTGKLKSHLALSLTHEYRIVFHIEKYDIYLLAIGTHDEVY